MKRFKRGRKPKGYDSKFEHTLHKSVLKGLKRNTKVTLPYVVRKKYKPDFLLPSDDKILVEVKGRFRTSEEAAKYVHFRKSNPDYTIIFIFGKPSLPMPHAKRRKDGSKMTHAEWARKHGFTYYSEHNTPEEWG